MYNVGCSDCKSTLNLSIGDSFKNLLNVAEKAFKRLHEKGSYKPQDLKAEPLYQDLINKTFDVFNLAIVDNDMPADMRTALQSDAFMFGGLKTHAQLFEASQLLLDEKGNLKSFDQVSNSFNRLNNTYNKNYLEAEYEFAVGSAQMAGKWSGLSDDTNRYYLQYRTAGDNKVRDEHKALNGITLPKNDPFWDSYYTPNGWRCRCNVVEVLADKYPTSNSKESIAKGEKATTKLDKNGKNTLEIFRFNPGKEKRLFPKTPVNNLRCAGNGKLSVTGLFGAPVVILSLEKSKCEAAKIIQQIKFENTKKFNVIKAYSNGGSISEHSTLNVKGNDYEKIKNCCKSFAKDGAKTEILPKLHSKSEAYKVIYKDLIETKYQGKCPDFRVNGKYYELEGFTTNDGKDKVSKMLTRGVKQSSRIVLENDGSTINHIRKLVNFRKTNGQDIKEVFILNNDNTLTQVY